METCPLQKCRRGALGLFVPPPWPSDKPGTFDIHLPDGTRGAFPTFGSRLAQLLLVDRTFRRRSVFTRLSETEPIGAGLSRCTILCMKSLSPAKRTLALAFLLALLLPASAGAVELRDAELVAGGSSVLQNGGGTVRLEDGRLGTLPVPVAVPEPGGLWQVGTAIGVLAFLRHRRRAVPDAYYRNRA
jgi:hypothetical protein